MDRDGRVHVSSGSHYRTPNCLYGVTECGRPVIIRQVHGTVVDLGPYEDTLRGSETEAVPTCLECLSMVTT